MRCWQRLAVWSCLCSCLLAFTLAPALGAGGLADAGAAQPETDNTVTRVQVHGDGAATWTIHIRTRLSTDEQVDEYRSFQREFRNNTSRYLDPFRERITGVVGDAAKATGREMAARNFSATTSIQQVPRRWGVVTYRFTWTNMAQVRGDRVVVGDVFQGGFYLAANDTLVLVAPANHSVASVDPDPAERDGDTVTWAGEHNFADGRPRAAFAPESAGATATKTPVGGGSSPSTWWVVAALFAGGAVMVYALVRTGYLSRPSGIGVGETLEPSTPATEPDELLTDADRVEQLLDEHGGRMRQAQVADELEWSASKTSRVVSDMADEGRIEKLRIGRENVLELKEE